MAKRVKRPIGEPTPGSGRAWGYRRASTLRQVQSGLGMEAQEAAIRKAAQRLELELMEPIIAEEAISGGKPLLKRPAGSALSICLKSGDTLIVSRSDRLFRNAADAMQCVDLWKPMGIRLLMLDMMAMPIELESPWGFFFVGILAMVGQMERVNLSERQLATYAAKRARGECPPGAIPLGYKGEGKGKHRKRVPDWAMRTVALHIMKWKMEGYTSLAIRIRLRESRVIPPTNGNKNAPLLTGVHKNVVPLWNEMLLHRHYCCAVKSWRAWRDEAEAIGGVEGTEELFAEFERKLGRHAPEKEVEA